MTKMKEEGEPEVSNVISDDTGNLDERFMLWREFCDEYGIAVETLPGDLEEPFKGKWETLKDEVIHKPIEGRT